MCSIIQFRRWETWNNLWEIFIKTNREYLFSVQPWHLDLRAQHLPEEGQRGTRWEENQPWKSQESSSSWGSLGNRWNWILFIIFNYFLLTYTTISGLRSLRFAKEVPGLSEIITNDFSIEAVKMIEKNVKLNEVEDIVKPSKADAM